MKFGGSSVADHPAMQRCAKIISATPRPQVIVISALAGITRQLMRLSYPSTLAPEKTAILQEIYTRHYGILAAIEATNKVKQDFNQLFETAQYLTEALEQKQTPKLLDELLSLGERMATLVFAEVLSKLGMSVQLFDVRQILRTDSSFGKAEPNIKAIKALSAKHLRPCLHQDALIITQGFIGSDAHGNTTILGKESSDYSAALLAEALEAHEFKIWTDVAGVYSTDPKLYPEAKPIAHLSFGEALELTTFGAKVLHARTLQPAIRKNIKCFVGSSIHPGQGTWINGVGLEEKPAAGVKAISLKKHQMLLSLERTYKTPTLNFLESFLETLAQHQLDFDLLTNHALSTTLVLDDSLVDWHQKSVLSETLLQELTRLGRVEVYKELTLLALVGQEIPTCPRIKKILSNTLKDLNVHAFYYGTSPYSLCILTELPDTKIRGLVARLHKDLIGAPE